MKGAQRLLPFPKEPANHTAFARPPYERILEEGHDGISPREAFLRAETLLKEKNEREIAESLYSTMEYERGSLWMLLTQIYNGAPALNRDQTDNAMTFAGNFNELTELERAWWTWELNVSPLLEKLTSKRSKIFVKKFKREIGKFRSAIQQILPSPVQLDGSSPPHTPGEADEQSAQ